MDRLNTVLGHIQTQPVAAPASLVSVAGIQNGVALIVINNPPVNSFSPKVAEALDAAFTQCLDNDEVKAIVLTGAGKVFMAGADIPHLLKITQSPDPASSVAFLDHAHSLANKIEASKKPVVAALNGDALGGGCELAIACHARVGTPKVKVGLPELQLGVIPGLGGTQRLPRLVGAQAGVQAILTSKPFKGPQALKAGVVDLIVPKPDQLIPAASKYALDIASGKLPKRQSSKLTDKVPSKEEITAIILGAKVQTKKKTPNLTHPLRALEAIETGLLHGSEKGIQAEIKAFGQCLAAPEAKALLHFFLASKATTKIPGVDLTTAGKVRSAAVIGGGTMGAGICICLLMKGIPVILKEVNEKFLKDGVERILNDITTIVRARKMNPLVIEHMMRGLTPQLTFDNFDKVDLVIEAIIENIEIKQNLFADLERVCSPTAILATNTSTINIETVAAKTKAQSRILGLHFFSPAHIMPLLEIVRTKHTDPKVLATCVVLAKTIGKTPVVVGNCVGFVANRVFFPYTMAGALLVRGGLDPYTVDKALMAFGMPMGIFRMQDSVGVDIGTHIGPIFNNAYKERVYPANLPELMVAAKRLGQKSNVGFYKYLQPRKASPDPEGLAPILTEFRKGANLPDTRKFTPQDIIEICLYPVINECARTLAEGYASSAADIDVVSVMGYGFPAYRGGLMTYGAHVGFNHIAKRLQHWASVFPEQKGFFEPSSALIDLANKKK